MIGRTRSSRGRARNLSPEERQLWGKVARQITPLTRTTVADGFGRYAPSAIQPWRERVRIIAHA